VLHRTIALLAGAIVGLYAATPVSAITLLSSGARNADGSFNSLYPRDDQPLTPPSGDYTERCIGTNFTACETSEAIVATGDATIQTNLSNRRTGLTGITYTVATAIDGKVKADIESVVGTNTYRAAGVALFINNAGAPDYANGVRCQQPATAGQMVRLIPIVAGVQGTVQYSASSDTTLPGLMAIQYDYSADLVQCLEWDGAEWDMVGEYTLDLTAPYYLALTAESDTPAGVSSTAIFDDVVFNNTLETVGGGTPSQPDPDPTPTSGAGVYPDPVLGVVPLGGRTAANCTTAACIATNLVCGRTITLTAAITDDLSINSSCAADNPVQIDGNGNSASGVWTYTTASARNIVQEVKFTYAGGTQVNLGGTNNKHIRNEHTGWGSASVTTAYAICATAGSDGEIGYTWFHDPGAWRATTITDQSRVALRTCEGSTGASFHTGMRVHNNLFSDFPDKPIPTSYGSGQNDAIEVCQTNVRSFIVATSFNTGWWIERNLVLRHLQGGQTGAATIDIKCPAGMVVRYNTMTSSNGRIDIRSPNPLAAPAWFEGNYSLDKGSTIHGANHKLLGNVGTMTLRAGGNDCNVVNTTGDYHSRVCGALIEGGSGNITVGSNAGPGTQLPALNTVIRDRSCSGITLSNHSGTTNDCANTTSTQVYTEAFAITEDDVGPTRAQYASSAWRTPRLQ
jgi:hypothetical protein